VALTPQATLRDRILLILHSLNNGTGTRADVLETMEAAFSSEWTAEDVQPQNKRPWETKWRNRASYERADMVRDGLLSERADGYWSLTPVGQQAAAALVSSAASARGAERERRDAMWEDLTTAGGPESVSPSILNNLRIFRGGRGIYADGESTRTLDTDGVTVSFLHNGSSYDDELSPTGVRYHYPTTTVPGRDAAEVSASKAAYRLGLPVFVVTAGKPGSTRTVYRGYIEDFDDSAGVFLVTFTTGTLPPPPPSEDAISPFSLLDGADDPEAWSKRRSRPNQQRFAFQVLRRYGAACAVCGLAIAGLVQAAHLLPKKDKGSDDPRNGLPLCSNHHLAFDKHLWMIDPASTAFVTKPSGPSLGELLITRSDLAHLPARPHDDALNEIWTRWIESFN
jgi:hypothetical protein